MSTDSSSEVWIKATASGGGGSDCVELLGRAEGVDVRDSKDPDGPRLTYTKSEFAAWLDGAKKGEFDHLI